MTHPIPDPIFARAGDLLVARIGDHAVAFMPGRAGHHFAYSFAVDRPMSDWTRSDFYGHAGALADESAFQAAVLEQHRHQVERRDLGRVTTTTPVSTPWGAAQATTVCGPGIRSHARASHGGFEVDRDRNSHIHQLLRNPGGWYEEDCEWAAVALTFPELFTTFERHQADRSLRHFNPDAWQVLRGRTSATSSCAPPPRCP